ncbi:phosphatidate cytidylyltransferase [Paenibacillus marchantiophytorum]|uniref:Phosphatidate cytidylyltransferase n=1 Tax=Paenibacillus marchantiophytorum TaxID=1619310 RepID=A0ABQ1ERJ6_9BACL|nr:phosphatidate cytidylyltransferase [Paenibacillus marchantiophytorum]GFZ84111.1 phosphatidate cytidylyltransferase [Paenibacillus marchantiophytorum]
MKQRIVTGVIAGFLFITLLVLGGYWYAGLIVLVSILGYREYLQMNGYSKFKLTSAVGLIALLYITIPWDWVGISIPLTSTAVIWLLMFLLLFITVATKNKITIDQVSVMLLGVVYIGFGFYYMISSRLAEHGLFWTILVFVCIWASDSGAYFVGSKLGKNLLWPQISPKKSVEGAVGGVVISMIIALVFAWYAPDLLGYGRALFLGLVIAVVGQVGDLIQSAYKRVKGIKDTGTLLPGHGGVLDRMDSWLIVFPFIHLLGMIPH